jgi:homocitrate synthase NifV
VHCHDDFGMATANAVSALGAGADMADVTVLGIGERTGVSRLEEVASFLALRRGVSGLDLLAIREACTLVARAAELPVPRNKPICGRDIFACESGLHAHGMLRDPALFEPFPPGAVGAPEGARQVRLGAKTGRAAVAAAMDRMGLGGSGDAVGAATERVRRTAASLGRPLTDPELAAAIGH